MVVDPAALPPASSSITPSPPAANIAPRPIGPPPVRTRSSEAEAGPPTGRFPLSPCHPIEAVRSSSAPVVASTDSPAHGAASSDTLKQRWFSATKNGRYASVQSGIREGWAPLNACDQGGYTALMRCCVSGQLLELLLGCKGVDVNLTGAPDGTTPLMLAARYRTSRVVDSLLKADADLGGRDAHGNTVLHKAAANPNEGALRLLLGRGADPCGRDGAGRCALAAALLHGNEATAAVLLEHWQACAADGAWRERRLGERAAPPAEVQPRGEGSGAGAGGAEGGDAGGSGGEAEEGEGCDGGDGEDADGVVGWEALPDELLDHVLRSAALREARRLCGVCRRARAAFRRRARSPSTHHPGPALPSSTQNLTASAGSACRHHDPHRPAPSFGRSYEAWLWLSPTAVDEPITKPYPRGHTTTLLHLAAAEGMERVVLLLLARGASLRATDADGLAPAELARRRGRTKVVALLEAASARAERSSSSGGEEWVSPPPLSTSSS